MGPAKTNIQIYHNGVAQGENRFTSTYRSSNQMQSNPKDLSQRASLHRHPSPLGQNDTGSKSTLMLKGSNQDLRRANFSLGNNRDQIRSTNQSNLNNGANGMSTTLATQESRNELKARMSQVHFSFGNTKENTGMSQAKTIYSSQNTPKQGTDAIGNRDMGNMKNNSNIKIGTMLGVQKGLTSEAQTQFVSKQQLLSG